MTGSLAPANFCSTCDSCSAAAADGVDESPDVVLVDVAVAIEVGIDAGGVVTAADDVDEIEHLVLVNVAVLVQVGLADRGEPHAVGQVINAEALGVGDGEGARAR